MLLLATAGGLLVSAMAATAATLASLSRTGSGLAGAAWVSTDSTVAGCFGLPCGAARSLAGRRSEEHTSELQSLLPISYAVFCSTKQQSTSLGHPTTPRTPT